MKKLSITLLVELLLFLNVTDGNSCNINCSTSFQVKVMHTSAIWYYYGSAMKKKQQTLGYTWVHRFKAAVETSAHWRLGFVVTSPLHSESLQLQAAERLLFFQFILSCTGQWIQPWQNIALYAVLHEFT